MDFSFCVTTYNQANIVVDTLESIRYQVERFGKGKEIQLIISDDGSTDGTFEIIKRWVKERGNCFCNIVLESSKTNMGICANCAKVFRMIEPRCFFSIAGDDILAPVDVISIVESFPAHYIVSAPRYFFSEGKICRDRKKYIHMFTDKDTNIEKVRKKTYYGNPIQNGSFWDSDFLTEEVISFMEEFDMLEDQAQWIKIFENFRDIHYAKIGEALILYRISENQVTNFSGPYYKRVSSDKKKLYEYAKINVKSPIVRYICWCETIRVCSPSVYRYFVRLLDFRNYVFYYKIIFYRSQIERKVDSMLMNTKLEEYDAFLKKILQLSETFYLGTND